MYQCFRGGGGTLGIFGLQIKNMYVCMYVPLWPWNPFLGLRRPKNKLSLTFTLYVEYRFHHTTYILPITYACIYLKQHFFLTYLLWIQGYWMVCPFLLHGIFDIAKCLPCGMETRIAAKKTNNSLQSNSLSHLRLSVKWCYNLTKFQSVQLVLLVCWTIGG